MNFTRWNHVEITAYIFQSSQRGGDEVVALVKKRLETEK